MVVVAESAKAGIAATNPIPRARQATVETEVNPSVRTCSSKAVASLPANMTVIGFAVKVSARPVFVTEP